MKKTISFILMITLTASLIAGAAFADAGMSNFKKISTYANGQFTDVSANEWYGKYVAGAYEYGLIKGMSNNSFGVSGNLKISEVVALAARLNSIYTTGKADFSQTTPWSKAYVDYAVTQGIISKARFENYELDATRYQVAEILSAALPASELEVINNINVGDIPDVSLDSPYECIYSLYRAGILTGKSGNGKFCPSENIQRNEIAAIITRIVDKSSRVKFSIDPNKDPASTEDLASILNMGSQTAILAFDTAKSAAATLLSAKTVPERVVGLTLLSKAQEYTQLAAAYAQKAAAFTKDKAQYAKVYENCSNAYLGCVSASDYLKEINKAGGATSTVWDSLLNLLMKSGESFAKATEASNGVK